MKPTASVIGETDESHLRLIAKKRWLMPRGRAACIAGADAIAALDSLRVELSSVEWSGRAPARPTIQTCPICLSPRPGQDTVHTTGHDPDCWLGSIAGAL